MQNKKVCIYHPSLFKATAEYESSHRKKKKKKKKHQCGEGPLVISMKISPSRVEKYLFFSTLLAGTKIMS